MTTTRDRERLDADAMKTLQLMEHKGRGKGA
jgi:hypothetical protein